MEGETNKVFLELEGRTVLEHSLEVFNSIDEIVEIVLVISEADKARFEGDLMKCLEGLGVSQVVHGGARRCDSAANGVAGCSRDTELLLIHDGARPFPPRTAVREAIANAAETGGAILATPLSDTLKLVGRDQQIEATPPREDLWHAQTPQVFRQELYREALRRAQEMNLSPTDDALILEAAGCRVKVVDGGSANIKITTREDLELARAIVKMKQMGGART
jgi:2-C-methyl-D-erythritol 4-phosphate cytidylyltransferase